MEVRPLSGESFDIKLNAKAPTVGEAKEQIERDEGTKKRRQLLCRVQVSSDGSNVREFDQEPEELKEDGMALTATERAASTTATAWASSSTSTTARSASSRMVWSTGPATQQAA